MLLSPQVAPVYEIAIPVESISESEKGSYVFCKLVLKLAYNFQNDPVLAVTFQND